MRPRDTLLLDTYTLSDSETHIIDVNVNKPISAIQVYYTAKNGATRCASNWLWENITKIELVDASEVLWSLDAPEAQGLAFYGHGIEARDYLTEVGSGVQACDIWMAFGRYLYDQVYAFDPTKHSNPQLKLTHNIENIASLGDDAFLTGNVKVRILAKLMEEAAAPTGFLMSKQHYNYNTGSTSKTEYIDLPTDHPCRMLMFRCYIENKNGQEIVQAIKLNIDSESYIPFDLTGSDLADIGMKLRGLARESIRAHVIHNDTVDLMVMDPRRYGVTGSATVSDVIIAPITAANRITVCGYDISDAAAFSTRQNVYLMARGIAKHGCLVYPFGRIDLPEDWLDLTKFGSIRLEAQTEGWSAAASVVLQQVKTY